MVDLVSDVTTTDQRIHQIREDLAYRKNNANERFSNTKENLKNQGYSTLRERLNDLHVLLGKGIEVEHEVDINEPLSPHAGLPTPSHQQRLKFRKVFS